MKSWFSAGARLALAGCFSVFAAIATAQDAAAPAPAPATQAPANNWASRCVAGARQGPLECSIEQRLVMQNTGQLVAAVTIRLPTDSTAPVMMIQTPLGLLLPPGVRIDIDGGAAQTLPLQTCDNSGCYAGNPVSDEMLNAMAGGSKLNLTFQNLNKQDVTVSATLVGFTAAFQRIR